MSLQAHRKIVALIFTLAAFMLSNCMSLATLGDGRRTTMGKTGIATRNALFVSPEPFLGPLRYHPVASCEFILSESSPISRIRSYTADLNVNIRPIGDLLFLSSTASLGEATEESTAVIGVDGQLMRFNMMNIALGRRVTSDNFAEEATAELNRLGLGESPGVNFLNVFSFFTPHYRDTSLQVGSLSSEVLDETGGIWAYFSYSGISEFAGLKVLVLDLVRTLDRMPELGQVVTGFTLVDPENMLPVFSTIDFGSSGSILSIQRTRCQG